MAAATSRSGSHATNRSASPAAIPAAGRLLRHRAIHSDDRSWPQVRERLEHRASSRTGWDLLSAFPFYHAKAARLEDARYPQNAAHFGSPTRRQAGRLTAILDPARSCIVANLRLQRRRNAMSIYDQIQELRAEQLLLPL
jgi:hypothetical protein